MVTKIGMLERELSDERAELATLKRVEDSAREDIDATMERIYELRRRILHEDRHGDREDYT